MPEGVRTMMPEDRMAPEERALAAARLLARGALRLLAEEGNEAALRRLEADGDEEERRGARRLRERQRGPGRRPAEGH
jgi:hypothetical protein